jgi:hypothetical protein
MFCYGYCTLCRLGSCCSLWFGRSGFVGSLQIIIHVKSTYSSLLLFVTPRTISQGTSRRLVLENLPSFMLDTYVRTYVNTYIISVHIYIHNTCTHIHIHTYIHIHSDGKSPETPKIDLLFMKFSASRLKLQAKFVVDLYPESHEHHLAPFSLDIDLHSEPDDARTHPHIPFFKCRFLSWVRWVQSTHAYSICVRYKFYFQPDESRYSLRIQFI